MLRKSLLPQVNAAPKGPSFVEQRETDDGVMVADVGFKKQLWALDPELDVVWNKFGNKWEVWRFPGQARRKKKRFNQGAHHVTSIQTVGRTFREVGADVVLALQKGDTRKYSLNELVSYFDQMDENIERSKRRDLYNKISSITLETRDYMRGVLKVQVPKRFQGGHLINSKPSATKRIGGLVHV